MSTPNRRREKLANLCHKQWAGWMEYLFSKCVVGDEAMADGTPELVIPPSLAKRWKRQMGSPYSELPEEEKESDRKEADRFLKLLTPKLNTEPSNDLKEQLITLHSHLLDVGEWLMEGGTEVNMPEWYDKAMTALDEANKITYWLMTNRRPILNMGSLNTEPPKDDRWVLLWVEEDGHGEWHEDWWQKEAQSWHELRYDGTPQECAKGWIDLPPAPRKMGGRWFERLTFNIEPPKDDRWVLVAIKAEPWWDVDCWFGETWDGNENEDVLGWIELPERRTK